MKEINFKNLSIEILDSWKESKINESYTFIQSKKIGESYFTLSLYNIKDRTRKLNEVYKDTLKKYSKLKKFKLIQEDSSTKNGIVYKERQLTFYDKKRKNTITIREKIIDIDGDIYAVSGQMHDCPLITVYEKLLENIFNSITIKPMVSLKN